MSSQPPDAARRLAQEVHAAAAIPAVWRTERPRAEQVLRQPSGGADLRASHRAERFPQRPSCPPSAARPGPAVGLATVYGHLRKLVDAGEVDVLCDRTGTARYRCCGTAHSQGRRPT
jgi:hypothetical protein